MDSSKVQLATGLFHDAALLWAISLNKTRAQQLQAHATPDGFDVAKNYRDIHFEGRKATFPLQTGLDGSVVVRRLDSESRENQSLNPLVALSKLGQFRSLNIYSVQVHSAV